MTTNKNKPRGLGRGLSALMADVPPPVSETNTNAVSDRTIPIEQLVGCLFETKEDNEEIAKSNFRMLIGIITCD